MALVISTLRSGGAERVLSLLAGAWSAQGRDVVILTTHDGGHVPDYSVDPGVDVISVDPCCGGLRKQVEIVRAIRQHVADTRPDVVLSFLNYTNILVLFATHGLSVPVVISERLDPSVVGLGRMWSLLRWLSYRWTDILVAQTLTAARRFEALARERVRVVPNPLTDIESDAGADDPVEMPGQNFIAVGRLNPQKGFDVLLHAMAQVHRQLPDWRLVILGEGDSREELERLTRDLGLNDTVRMPGRVRNPWPWLMAADAYAMSSRSEGFPNALCEAMVAGLPIITTDCPSGPSDIVTDGIDGLLVPVDDVEGLAQGMLRLANSAELRRKLGSRARDIRNRYSMATVLEQWEAVFIEAGASRSH